MQIRIRNQVFHIQGVEDEGRMDLLTRHVESKMAELESVTGTVDSGRLALLAALHIADEYFRMAERLERLDAFVGRKSGEFQEILDRFALREPGE